MGKMFWRVMVGLTISGIGPAYSNILPEPDLEKAYQTVESFRARLRQVRQNPSQWQELMLEEPKLTSALNVCGDDLLGFDYRINRRWTGLPGDGAIDILQAIIDLKLVKDPTLYGGFDESDPEITRRWDKHRVSHFVEVVLTRLGLSSFPALKTALSVQLNSDYQITSIKRRQLVFEHKEGRGLNGLTVGVSYDYDERLVRPLDPASESKRVAVFLKRLYQRLMAYDWVKVAESIFTAYGFKGNDSHLFLSSAMQELRKSCHFLPQLEYRITSVRQGELEFDDPYTEKKYRLKTRLVEVEFHRPGQNETISNLILLDYQGGYRIMDFYVDDDGYDFLAPAD